VCVCVCVCVCLENGETLCELGLGGKIILQQMLSEYLRLWGGVIWIRTGSIGGLLSKRLRNRNPRRTERENRQGGGEGGLKILDKLRECQRPKEPELFGFSSGGPLRSVRLH